MFARSVTSRVTRRMRRLVKVLAARGCGKYWNPGLSAKSYETFHCCDSISAVHNVSSVVSRMRSLHEILQFFCTLN